MKKIIRKIPLSILLVIIVATLAYLFFLGKGKSEQNEFQFETEKENIESLEIKKKIGWITDLHASDKDEVEINEHEVIYSNAYKKILPEFFEKMEKEGIEAVVVTGDMTSGGQKKEVQDLKKTSEIFKGKMLWARGNHDRESTKTMENLGIEEPYYYTFDTNELRLIVLNVTDDEDGIDKKQMEWLEKRLKETELDVIVAMHTPIVDYEKGIVISDFLELEKILRESGKVKLVLSGSLHKDKELLLGEILHRTATPLTLEDHMGTYYIVEKIGETWRVRREKLEENK